MRMLFYSSKNASCVSGGVFVFVIWCAVAGYLVVNCKMFLWISLFLHVTICSSVDANVVLMICKKQLIK